MRSEALTFQQIIQRLTEFWEKQGCVVHQGYDVEVGAGTFNPATFLRCLGPEPYNTVFVEPSRRPTDGRYGENPNRVQLFHQLQVLMKPSPSDIQQLYLRSLEALGLDLTVHDIRFVHDDWESPTLGAWGLGWEVWCDGMEITQFTYFQAAGSLSLSPISVELAYGLERLAMFIQNVDNLFMVRWNDKLTFADISHQAEVEWSRYNFEEATTAMWHRHFEDYEKEVARLIEKKLPFPAYDFVLKTSHAFNMLDARGAISVTERTGYITRIRDLARKVAEGFVASREAKQFPLLSKKEPMKEPELPLCPSTFQEGKKRDFLLEIGSEQLPASFVPMGMRGLEAIFRSFLQEHGLTYSSLSVYGTPQRLAILIQDLPEGTKARQQEKKGPPVTTAFDTTGYLSPLGEGFIRSLGLTSSCSREELVAGRVDDLTIKEVKGTEYLFYLQKEPALSTMSLLSKELARLILQVDFPKKMRWGSGQVAYARPLRWLLALFGEEVIPFVLGNLTSCRHSMGHAQRKHIPIPIKTPTEYLNSLREHFVLADPYERKEHILQQIRSIEKQKQCSALAVDRVLPQVLYLTEWPEVTVGSFQETFLQAPAEVLISEMVEHQKYFPLADGQGHLCNAFLITADNTPSPLVVHGNERVLSARLSDGVFLYKQDVRTPLTQFNEKLKLMTFQKDLGSVYAKVERLLHHVRILHTRMPLAEESTLLRAALLCKSDLASALVGEFPELQGVIGKYYAKAQGESEQVALAIEEHWMPKAESAPLPTSPCGAIVSLADKIDNLLGYFHVGLKPSSSSDPYALKRQTFGLLRILLEEKTSLNLKELLLECSRAFPSTVSETVMEEILVFITNRAKSLFEEMGCQKDAIEASLQGSCLDPYLQFCKIQALASFKKSEEFSRFYEVYKRVKGLLEGVPTSHADEALLVHPAEQELLQKLSSLRKQMHLFLEKKDFLSTFQALAQLQVPLSALLDQVKVQADDPLLRSSRIALIAQVFGLFAGLLDFSKIKEEEKICCPS